MLRLRSLAGACAGVVVALTASLAVAADGMQTAAVPSGGFAVRAIINAGAKEIPQGVSFSLHRMLPGVLQSSTCLKDSTFSRRSMALR